MVLLGFGAWAFGLAQASGRRWRWLGRSVALAALLGAGVMSAALQWTPPAAAQAGEAAERFTPARLQALRDEGRPVFVNITAAWCVTCLVNERIALSPGKVREAFARRRVAYLKGDWTSGDPAITAFLRAHDRDGVPLYLLYPPAEGAPAVLPQILTETEVLSQLDRLGS
jgi:thiol:disulfide interchange protein DsbD